MRLMLDANVVLDALLVREPFYALSRKVCLLGIVQEAETFITTSMATDLFYILRKQHGSLEAQRMLEHDLSFLLMASVAPEDVQLALSKRWLDFEDCLVDVCARKIGADFLVTRNVRDFGQSTVPAITPEKLFEVLESRGFAYDEELFKRV